MSVTNSPMQIQCKFTDCTTRGQKWEFRDGKYCSTECEHKDRGKELLDSIENEHTICGTCGRIRGVVEKPPEGYFDTEKTLGGTLTRTETGELEFQTWGQVETSTAVIGFRYSTENEIDGACRCGTIGRTDGHGVLRELDFEAIVTRLIERIQELEREGKVDRTVNKSDVFYHLGGGDDILVALGRASYER